MTECRSIECDHGFPIGSNCELCKEEADADAEKAMPPEEMAEIIEQQGEQIENLKTALDWLITQLGEHGIGGNGAGILDHNSSSMIRSRLNGTD